MPEIKNTFLASKMNKDLDDRLLPNGEYRDAQNLQISRSEGSSVGEFENIKGNTSVANLLTGAGAEVIGQFTDETNNLIYIISAGYSGTAVCPRDLVVYSNGAQAGPIITLATSTGTVINPQAIGITSGMLLQGTSWNGAAPTVAPVVTNVTTTNITIDTSVTLLNLDEIIIGYANSIHEFNANTNAIKLLVRGSFLNFSKSNKIFGINLLEDLLFWTDNRNQPRKINVTKANPTALSSPNYYTREDQISVAKYYPYEVPLVMEQYAATVTATGTSGIRGYELRFANGAVNNVKIGDLVTGFGNQGPQEIWVVNKIDTAPAGYDAVVVYSNFLIAPTVNPIGANLLFSRPSSLNKSDEKNESYFETVVDIGAPLSSGTGAISAGNKIQIRYLPQQTPRVGDYITSSTLTGPSGVGITISDEVLVNSVNVIRLQPFFGGAANVGILVFTLTKNITINSANDDIAFAKNPNYDSNFKGDADFLEEKFVRFSYRFKYDDNEYSLSAPFTQICFIPKQYGQIGWGQNNPNQDMENIYSSTVVEWFENRIDTVGVKIPMPDGGTTAAESLSSLTNNYRVKEIDILYRESDSTSTKILKTIETSNITSGDLQSIPSNSSTQWYYNFDYKSIKPYKTLPSNQETRVYDRVPVKALGQEIISNRITYANFIEKHTPPLNLDYSVLNGNKSVSYNNYFQYPNHSVKQNRNYQVGFVLSDRYGRASSVVLSKYDDVLNDPGSTIYIPYKSFDDVQTSALSTYKWLGNSLNLTIKSTDGISDIPQSDGQPGLYKSYLDTSIDKIAIDDSGSGYTSGTTYNTQYNSGLGGTGQGLGTGLTVKVTSVGGGGSITGVEIVNSGTGYVNGEIVQLVGGGNDALVQVTVYAPNNTGWQSYKVVVKQQEQEYYNVYLPGFTKGLPVIGSGGKANRVAYAVILGDNINKVPRDLEEVGPLQTEFNSSVRLYCRVNNPTINNKNNNLNGGSPSALYWDQIFYKWNQQYFPKRIYDEAVTVGPLGAGGLEIGNSPFFPNSSAAGFFSNSSNTNLGAGGPQIPWGVTGADQSLYNQEQNPLAMEMVIGSSETQPQLSLPSGSVGFGITTIGALITNKSLSTAEYVNNGVAPVGVTAFKQAFCMNPFLSVSETTPVESNLEIFWESSTSSNLVDLYKQL